MNNSIGIKKYIGDRAFYRNVLAVAVPIMMQNGITNFVSLLDNIMVGRLGTEQMSGVAIVNQLLFVFTLCIFGTVSGAGIFAAQFHGKGDVEGVRQTFRFRLLVCLGITAAAILLFAFAKEQLIGLYLNDGSAEGDLELTLGYGVDYIKIMLIGLIPLTLTMAWSSTLRETEETLLPMIAGFIAVVCNCVGNYILIFGKFGAPMLGVRGAAISTVISRFVEAGILIVYVKIRQNKYPFIAGVFRHLFRMDRDLVKRIVIKGAPLLINETLWAFGVSALAQCYSMRGLAVVAGQNIASTITNVFNISYMALGTSVGIIVGKYLGAKQFDEAQDVDRKLIAFCVAIATVMGVLLYATAGLFPKIYNTTDEVRLIARNLLRVTAIFAPAVGFLHSCYFTLRSGGKTIITFLYDSVFMLCVSFPAAWLLAHLTGMPILPLYAICNGLDLIKCVIGYIMLKKKIWIHQIV